MARAMKDSGIPWIGSIPEDWEIKKLKYCSSFQQEKYGEQNADLSYIGLENIVSWTGKFVETDSQYDKTQAIVYKKGDILWGKLRPYLAKVYHAPTDGCCSSEFCVIRIEKNNCERYYWYLLISSEFVSTIDRSTYGTKMPRANADLIKNTAIPIPPIVEQRKIADYLDTECARIDSVMEQTRASIEEYKKLKQSIITEAVTKGIRSNRPMKDSGIEWIGQIPEDWQIVRHKAVMHKEKDICEHYNGEDVISLTMNGVIVRDLNAGGKMPTTFDGYQHVEPGTLLLCLFDIDVTPRCVGLVKNYGVTSPAYSKFIVHKGYYNAYYDYLLRSIDDTKVFVHLAKNLRSSLTESDFGVLPTIAPPFNEQQEIVRYLDRQLQEIDSLIERKTVFLSEMESYKKSLIFEYVTGKKEAIA